MKPGKKKILIFFLAILMLPVSFPPGLRAILMDNKPDAGTTCWLVACLPLAIPLYAVSSFFNLDSKSFSVQGKKVYLKKSSIKYYPDGGLKCGDLTKEADLPVGGQTLRFFKGRITFHQDGTVESGELREEETVKVGSREVRLAADTVGFHPGGNLRKGRLKSPQRFTVGGRTILFGSGRHQRDFIFFYPDGSVEMGEPETEEVFFLGGRTVRVKHSTVLFDEKGRALRVVK